MSKHIADLERALGLRLVERARRDGALTSAGEFVANHVLRAEALLVQASLGAAELRMSGSGSLAIAASWVTGTHLLPDIIAEFKQSHPGVRIALELGTAEQAVERVRAHRAELGFIANAVGAAEIEAEPLLKNEIVIVGRPALVPRRASRERLEALTWISREEGSATRSASERAMARLGIVPRRRLELPSYEAVLSALNRGYGIAAISRYIVAAELQIGALAVIPVRGWNVRAVISCFGSGTPSSGPRRINFGPWCASASAKYLASAYVSGDDADSGADSTSRLPRPGGASAKKGRARVTTHPPSIIR